MLSARQAAFIGVGAMVGAGIFSLLGAAGEVAGSAVWISFVIAGIVAGLQGYSFARMGARFPSAGGLLEYVARGYGNGHVTGVIGWLLLAVNAIITAMVAVSFGSYAGEIFADGGAGWTKFFAVVLVLAMTLLNILGSEAVAKAQTVVVVVVIGILGIFAVTTLSTIDLDLLAFSGYPSFRDIVASVALTFFAYLGFGVITFTAKDLANPARELPRAVYLALSIATVIYVAVSLGVFGVLTVDEVIESGGTALAVAAEPTLGSLGYGLMSVTALFATAGATNSGLYPAAGLCEQMATTGQFPPTPRQDHRWACPGRSAADCCRSDRAVGRLRPQRHRLDRERGRAGGLRARHERTHARQGRNRRQGVDPPAGGGDHSHRPGDLRVHDPGRGAQDGRRAHRDPRSQHRARPRLEAAPRSHGLTPGRPAWRRNHPGGVKRSPPE